MQKSYHYRNQRKNYRVRHIVIIAVLLLILIALVSATVYFTSLNRQQSKTKIENSSSMMETSAIVNSLESGSSFSGSEGPAFSGASSGIEEPAPSSSVPDPVSSLSSPAGSVPIPAQYPYQELYPDLYVSQVEKVPAPDGANVAYLTFDDGPSSQTKKVLDILDEYDVKATFFLVGKGDEESKQIIKDIYDRGHALGVHTYSHDYKKIYASPEAFLEDFSKMRDLIVSITGEQPTMFRFAGGSVNSYNKTIAKALIDEMTRRGYTYFDWNVSAGDAERGATAQSIYNDTVNGVRGKNKSIILCHDAPNKSDTVKELPAILKELKNSGYHFEKLDPSVKPIIFPVPKE